MRSALTASVLVGLWSGLWVGGAAHATEVPKRGGTLNFAVVAEPPTTDCHATTTFAMVHPVTPQYSTLLAFVGPHDKIKIEGDHSPGRSPTTASATRSNCAGVSSSTTAPISRPRTSRPPTNAS